jgi:peroxiredoxin Q/BCP
MKWMAILAFLGLAYQAGALSVGDAVPDFSAAVTDGTTLTPAALKGKWVVLYFYPKSFTPGCTAESCALRDGHDGIQKLKATIYGVSLDAMDSQKKFKKEYRLPFELVSDQEKKMATAFGVLGMGGLYAQRVTFIVSPEGKIAAILDRVDTAGHDKQVAEALAGLQKP